MTVFSGNTDDDRQRKIRPGLGFIQTINPAIRTFDSEIHTDITLERMQTTNLMMRSAFLNVPRDLIEYVHQPMHGALDDIYLNTRIPPKVALAPDNFWKFEKRFKQQLSLQIEAEAPEKFCAESLQHPKLGDVVIRRKPELLEFTKLYIAQERLHSPNSDENPTHRKMDPAELLRLVVAQEQRFRARDGSNPAQSN